METFMIVWMVVGGIMVLIGMIGFIVNWLTNDYNSEERAMNFLVLAGAGVVGPLLIPAGLVATLVLMVMQVCIATKAMKAPKWWPWE